MAPIDEASRKQYEALAARVGAEPGAERTKSGLVYEQLEPGSGATPRGSDTVTVRYQIKAPDGTVVEDSAAYGGTVTVRLDQLRPCQREVLSRMRVHGRSRFVCPLPDRTDGAHPGQLRPVSIEVTLVDVGRPLSHPGH
jgi:FKBP-type peptidyl-prolyl cis-trans isomerase